jgi:hypothetical protein
VSSLPWDGQAPRRYVLATVQAVSLHNEAPVTAPTYTRADVEQALAFVQEIAFKDILSYGAGSRRVQHLAVVEDVLIRVLALQPPSEGADVLVDAEAGFTRAFHRGCGSPMRNVTARAGLRSLEDEHGVQLHLWECAGCGAMVLAGMDKDCRIVHRQLSLVPRAAVAALLGEE